ncbi:hypothetical protein C9J85_17450 [Haloferax sp. wsp5]|nr:hypothetical protein C9J85_17450 [Haloferax sp. wsp5]
MQEPDDENPTEQDTGEEGGNEPAVRIKEEPEESRVPRGAPPHGVTRLTASEVIGRLARRGSLNAPELFRESVHDSKE